MIAAAAASSSDVVAFHVHWDTIGLVLALALGYELGLARLAAGYAPRGEEAITRRQRIYFYSGLALMFAVSTWPIHDIGERSLYMFHMIEHLTLALAVPPLLLWGTPWWLLRAVLLPVMPIVKVLAKPFVALFLFNATLGLIHAPGIVEEMVTNPLFHFVSHGVLFVTAILMWFPVIGPIPDIERLRPFQRMGYLFLQSLVPTVPASFLTLGDQPLYKIYETFPRLWGISAHTDQVIAGFIMKFGGGLLLWVGITYVFFSWHAEEQRYTAQGVIEPIIR